MSLDIEFRTLPHFAGLELPSYHSEGASGMDICAACPKDKPLTCPPGQTIIIPTGLCLAIPEGHEGQIRPRSGLAARHGLTCLNSPGTIDADYRGEIKVLLINHGKEAVKLERGMRIAQLVIAPVTRARLIQSKCLSSTIRNEKGFGSTGV